MIKCEDKLVITNSILSQFYRFVPLRLIILISIITSLASTLLSQSTSGALIFTPNGKTIQYEELLNRSSAPLVILYSWGCNSLPCRKPLDSLQKIYIGLERELNVEIISINWIVTDKYLKCSPIERGWSFPFFWSPDMNLCEIWAKSTDIHCTTCPSLIYIDRKSQKTFYKPTSFYKIKEDIRDLCKMAMREHEEERKRSEAEAQRKMLEEKENKFQKFFQEAESLFNRGQYTQAREYYNKSLTILPGDSRSTPKLREIDDRLKFRHERKYTVYDYRDTDYALYQNINSILKNRTKEEIVGKMYVGNAEIEAKFLIDTFGVTKYAARYVGNSSGSFLDAVNAVSSNINLNPTKRYGYSYSAQADYNIKINAASKVINIRKSNVDVSIPDNLSEAQKKEVETLIASGPMGSYRIQMYSGNVNDLTFSNHKITKYYGTGGPGNALKSVLVPGLGVKAVTGGKQNGLQRAAGALLFVGFGIGYKVESNKEYKKYLAATSQDEIDKYYKEANRKHKTFLGLVAAGGIIWTYDVFWVADKGFKNRKEQKKYMELMSL